jgi:hypothetical protein
MNKDKTESALLVTDLRFEGAGASERIIITLSTGEEEELDPDSLAYREPDLFCRAGKEKNTARFSRSPFIRILDGLREENGDFYLNICGRNLLLKKGNIQ